MTTEPAGLSTTDKNLWAAIVSEAVACLKYNAFAHKALEEGHPEVAQVFQEVAGAEIIHGINHLRVSGDVATTLENLRTVTEGESKEFSTFYPRMIKDAVSEGRRDAADAFSLAMDRERRHLEVFSESLRHMEAKSVAAQVLPAAQVVDAAAAEEPHAAAQALLAPAGPDLDIYVTAAVEVDKERWRVARLARLRELVFGAQDGLLSTVALVTGVAVAVQDQTTVLVAGLAAALPGMLSMATGAFLGSRAEQDVQRSEIEREARELEANPAEELAELVVLYQREGMTYSEARHIAEDIAKDKDLWLRTLVEKELGISPDMTSSPVKDAPLVMGAAFIVAAAIPILPHFFLNKTASRR